MRKNASALLRIMPSEWAEISTLRLHMRQALVWGMPCSRVVSCLPYTKLPKATVWFQIHWSQALTFSIPYMLLSRLYILKLIPQNCHCGMFTNHLCPPISPFSWIFEVKWNCSWIFGKSQHIVHFGHQSVHNFYRGNFTPRRHWHKMCTRTLLSRKWFHGVD